MNSDMFHIHEHIELKISTSPCSIMQQGDHLDKKSNLPLGWQADDLTTLAINLSLYYICVTIMSPYLCLHLD